MEKDHYIIGTRGSLLALTQCLQIKEELEEKSGKSFELKIIKTQGDENTQAPLWQLEGKDFFTKELDEALLNEEIDMVVHSYKDLGSVRPEGIHLAAITKRKYAHDILLIRDEVVSALKKKEKPQMIVGTSSPRRITNIEASLHEVLPFGQDVSVETKMLRGNVNTRIDKLKKGQYDAIVLALPGIERLAQGLPAGDNPAREKHGDPRTLLSELLKGLNFMILPTSQFPAAASQGALGIECLEKREDMKTLLALLNDKPTIKEVAVEREYFQSYGGGCHLAVGITARQAGPGIRLSQKGKVDEKEIDHQSMLPKKEWGKKIEKAFIGLPSIETFINDCPNLKFEHDFVFEKKPLTSQEMPENRDLFVASPAALKHLKGELPTHKSLWASGARTMKLLASEGHWVNGSADALGECEADTLRESHLLQLLLGKKDWLVITNNHSQSSLGKTAPTYEKIIQSSAPKENDLKDCDFYYWSSPTQYSYYKENFQLNPEALHASGLGKTFEVLKEEPHYRAFSSMRELKEFLKQKG